MGSSDSSRPRGFTVVFALAAWIVRKDGHTPRSIALWERIATRGSSDERTRVTALSQIAAARTLLPAESSGALARLRDQLPAGIWQKAVLGSTHPERFEGLPRRASPNAGATEVRRGYPRSVFELACAGRTQAMGGLTAEFHVTLRVDPWTQTVEELPAQIDDVTIRQIGIRWIDVDLARELPSGPWTGTLVTRSPDESRSFETSCDEAETGQPSRPGSSW